MAFQGNIKLRKKITDELVGIMKDCEPEGTNAKAMREYLEHMTDKEFDQWMVARKDGRAQVRMVVPNGHKPLELDNIRKAMNKAKIAIEQRILIKDPVTGKTFRSAHKHIILRLPVRPQMQYLGKKSSVAVNDKHVDGMTGQVTGDDRASSTSRPQMQALFARGLPQTLKEVVKVRGGDVNAYGELTRAMQETGQARMEDIMPGTRARVVDAAHIFLKQIHIDNNL